MKKFVWVALLLFTACHPKVAPNTDPAAIKELNVREVVIAVGTIQHTAIELNTSQLLSDNTTGHIVDTVKSVVNVIQARANGWQAVVIQALTELENGLPANERDKIVSYIEIAKGLLGRIG